MAERAKEVKTKTFAFFFCLFNTVQKDLPILYNTQA